MLVPFTRVFRCSSSVPLFDRFNASIIPVLTLCRTHLNTKRRLQPLMSLIRTQYKLEMLKDVQISSLPSSRIYKRFKLGKLYLASLYFLQNSFVQSCDKIFIINDESQNFHYNSQQADNFQCTYSSTALIQGLIYKLTDAGTQTVCRQGLWRSSPKKF